MDEEQERDHRFWRGQNRITAIWAGVPATLLLVGIEQCVDGRWTKGVTLTLAGIFGLWLADRGLKSELRWRSSSRLRRGIALAVVLVALLAVLSSGIQVYPIVSGFAERLFSNVGGGFASHSVMLRSRTLSLFKPQLDTSTTTVVINGVDTAQPRAPFRFDWGDGTATEGFFPQSKTYAQGGQIYHIIVTATYPDGSQDNVSSTITLPYRSSGLQVVSSWLGFANRNAAHDRDAELRENCGDFRRLYVPDNLGNGFTSLCAYVGKNCTTVCDWKGQSWPCDAVSQGGRRDGTRVARCL
jgi:hypothetical protein